MSKPLGPLAIEQFFDSIWERWPNKEGEHAARKAINVYFKSGGSRDDLQKACDAYLIDNATLSAEFHYRLANFINQDHWKDLLESDSLDGLIKKKEEASELVAAWNAACKKHWNKVVDIEARMPIAINAINNSAFRKNWKKALDLACKIFNYKRRDDDPRSKIILSFSWFCNVDPTKHTVIKLLEGGFGEPQHHSAAYIAKKKKQVDEKERLEAIEEFKKLFPNIKPKPKEEIVKKEPTKEISEKAKEIVKQILSAPRKDSNDDDSFALY